MTKFNKNKYYNKIHKLEIKAMRDALRDLQNDNIYNYIIDYSF